MFHAHHPHTSHAEKLSFVRPTRDHHRLRTAALLAGVTAAGFAASRILYHRREELRRAERSIAQWIDMRVDAIKTAFLIERKEEEWLRQEILHTARSILRILHRAGQFARPLMRAKIELAMEERLLDLKRRVLKRVAPSAAAHAGEWHAFFETLREQLFGCAPKEASETETE